MAKKIKWYRVAEDADAIQFSDNMISTAEAGNKTVCIAKFNDQLFGFAYKCPHASGILANGYLDPLGNVVCPLHRYKYNITNGRNTSGEGYYLKTYPVELREDGVYVGIEEGWSLF